MQSFSCQQRIRKSDSRVRSRDELQITVSSATGLLDFVSATASVEDYTDSGNHSAAQRKLVVIKKGSCSVIKQCKNRRQRLSELENTKKRKEEELQDEIGQLESYIQETENVLPG